MGNGMRSLRSSGLFGFMTLDSMRLFGGRRIDLMNTAYEGEDVLREIDFMVYFAALIYSWGGKKEFFAAPQTIAEIVGRKVGTVRKSIKRLCHAKMLIRSGHRIVNRKTKKGFTVATIQEGRRAVNNGSGLSFASNAYQVVEPKDYLKRMNTKHGTSFSEVINDNQYDFNFSPSELGVVEVPKFKKLRLKDKTYSH